MKKYVIAVFVFLACVFFSYAEPSYGEDVSNPTPVSCAVDSDGNTQCSDETNTDCGDICQIVNNPADTDTDTNAPEPIDCSADPSPCERGGVVMYDKQIANTGVPTNTPENSQQWWNVFDSPKLIVTILFWGLLLNAATIMLLHTFYLRDAVILRSLMKPTPEEDGDPS